MERRGGGEGEAVPRGCALEDFGVPRQICPCLWCQKGWIEGHLGDCTNDDQCRARRLGHVGWWPRGARQVRGVRPERLREVIVFGLVSGFVLIDRLPPLVDDCCLVLLRRLGCIRGPVEMEARQCAHVRIRATTSTAGRAAIVRRGGQTTLQENGSLSVRRERAARGPRAIWGASVR